MLPDREGPRPLPFLPVLFTTLIGLTGIGATCSTQPPEIARERAIALARAQVSFEVTSVDAERTTDEGRRVWRVTLRGAPMSPDHPLLRPITIVLIDARTGAVVSLAKS